MARKVRKEIIAVADELRSWLPNFDHGPNTFPDLLWRTLASLPGGDEAEGIGYKPFEQVGWKEAELLEETLAAIETQQDTEDLIALLLEDEDDGEDDEDDED